MKKIVITASIIITILLAFIIPTAANSDGTYSNGTDMYSNGVVEFYSNIDDEDKLYKLNLSDMTEEKVLDEHIISMVNKDNYLFLLSYANGKSNLLKFDINDGTYLIEKEFNTVITNIAIRDDILYYIEDGSIFTYNVETNEDSALINNGITDLLLFTDYNTLKYYTKADGMSEYSENIYSFDKDVQVLEDDMTYGIDLMSASSYTPRLTAPSTTDPYYTTLNVFHTSGYGMVGNGGNCTCYAYGRSYENLGSKPSLSTGNAENWYNYNKNNGYYSYGKTPYLGAVAVWAKGVVGNNEDGAGHVAVVEVINGDTVTTSESGWNAYYFKTITRSASNSNFSQSSSYTFLGFIYVCDTFVTSGTCGDNITWSLNDGQLTISGSGAMWGWPSAVTPWAGVRENIKSITIGNGITTIGAYAFLNCTNLTSVSIPNSLSSIDGAAFENCSSLSYLSIPDSVTYIGGYAFYECVNLSEISIPEGVTAIGSYAFLNCENLRNAYVYSINNSFGESVFTNTAPEFALHGYNGSTAQTYASSNGHSFVSFYVNVTGVSLNKTSTTITVGNTETLTATISPSDATNKNVSWSSSNTSVATVSSSGVVTGKGPGIATITVTTADGAKKATCTVTVSTTVASGTCGDNLTWTLNTDGELVISGTGAMTEYITHSIVPWKEYRTQIKKVTIKSGVTTIGNEAFAGCSSLISITIPDTVKDIGSCAFYGCYSLASINIPAGVTIINNDTFHDCSSLTSIVIPLGVTNIESSAFAGCSLITSIGIPSSVTNIESSAFAGCSSLISVTIPDSVTIIGDDAFGYCKALTKTVVNNSETEFGADVFSNVNSNFQLHGYTGSTAEAYATENGHTFVALDATPEPFELSGVTMTLGSSLSLDFAVDTSKLTGTDNYAEFIIVYADGRESETVTVPQSEWTEYSGTIYTAKFTGMAAKQMNDVVTVVFYNAKGQVLTTAKSDSIETYAVRMLNGSAASNKKLRTVYVDMLNYGAAAQSQFGYDEENLANRNLTDAHKAWATASVATTDNRVKGTGYAGSTLTLSGEIQLDLVFNNSTVGSDYSSLYAIAIYINHYGHAKSVRVEGTDFIKYSSSLCQVSITGMAVADYKSVVSCTVYNANGVALASASDSVESYANRNAASLGATVDTIVKFGASSYNYFH